MAKQEEEKILLEREYIIPLRKTWLKTARYKRASKAVKAVKEFIAKHMKVENRDIRKVKLSKWLNEELWFRGIKKPAHKIKVKAIKYPDKVVVELVDIPDKIKWKIEREKRKEKTEEEKKKEEEKKVEKPEEKKTLEEKAEEKEEEKKEEEKTDKEKEEEKEKEEASKEAMLKQAEKQAKQIRHVKGAKQEQKHQMRKALAK